MGFAGLCPGMSNAEKIFIVRHDDCAFTPGIFQLCFITEPAVAYITR